MKIISLVPSITEALFDFGLTDREIIGRTKFCIHPANLVKKVPIIGGTKNLRIDFIKDLKPDLIIANKEENEKSQAEVLTEHFPVWLTDIANLEDNLQFLFELGIRLGKPATAAEFINKINKNLESLHKQKRLKTAYLIWNKPMMAAGGGTFISAVMAAAGFENIFEHRKRYPEIANGDLANADVILLSTEPYPFKTKHLEEFKSLFPDKIILLADGEAFSWYGTHLAKCGAYLRGLAETL